MAPDYPDRDASASELRPTTIHPLLRPPIIPTNPKCRFGVEAARGNPAPTCTCPSASANGNHILLRLARVRICNLRERTSGPRPCFAAVEFASCDELRGTATRTYTYVRLISRILITALTVLSYRPPGFASCRRRRNHQGLLWAACPRAAPGNSSANFLQASPRRTRRRRDDEPRAALYWALCTAFHSACVARPVQGCQLAPDVPSVTYRALLPPATGECPSQRATISMCVAASRDVLTLR